MIITIASYLVSTILPFALYQGYLRYVNRNIPKVLEKTQEHAETVSTVGLSTFDYEIPPETEDEYLKRLQFIHRDAWAAYLDGYKDKRIITDSDRHINLLILKYRNGEIDMECRTHTMDFSDGTEIWIGNKYYSYGNVYTCKRRELEFEYRDGRLSPYTFLSIVDLEMEKMNFSMWKKHHDTYSRLRYKKIKNKLGL